MAWCFSDVWPLKGLYAIIAPYNFQHIHTPTLCQTCNAPARSPGAGGGVLLRDTELGGAEDPLWHLPGC